VIGGRFVDPTLPDSAGVYNCDMLIVDYKARKKYTLPFFPVNTLIGSVLQGKDFYDLFQVVYDANLAVTEGNMIRIGAYFLVYNGREITPVKDEDVDRLIAEVFEGFSIGSNDLTQLTLGVDRDSEQVRGLFNENNPAVKALTSETIEKAKATGTKVGLCGQAPSDYPHFAAFLVECGIDSISFNPDALLRGIANIDMAENPKLPSLKLMREEGERV
jgi:PEP-utilising enzyme, PEP-binding domain